MRLASEIRTACNRKLQEIAHLQAETMKMEAAINEQPEKFIQQYEELTGLGLQITMLDDLKIRCNAARRELFQLRRELPFYYRMTF